MKKKEKDATKKEGDKKVKEVKKRDVWASFPPLKENLDNAMDAVKAKSDAFKALTPAQAKGEAYAGHPYPAKAGGEASSGSGNDSLEGDLNKEAPAKKA